MNRTFRRACLIAFSVFAVPAAVLFLVILTGVAIAEVTWAFVKGLTTELRDLWIMARDDLWVEFKKAWRK